MARRSVRKADGLGRALVVGGGRFGRDIVEVGIGRGEFNKKIQVSG